ncbi:hypothetical protein FRC02_004922 [Tulasnella sp. 418]|nr:hypothetical protein FRC02_004922 [Tulasnella sp. 418]
MERTPKDAENPKQMTLDTELLMKPAAWSKEGLKEHLITFVIQEDHVSTQSAPVPPVNRNQLEHNKECT